MTNQLYLSLFNKFKSNEPIPQLPAAISHNIRNSSILSNLQTSNVREYSSKFQAPIVTVSKFKKSKYLNGDSHENHISMN